MNRSRFILIIMASLWIGNSNAEDVKQRPLRKSKEIALIKAVGGSIATTAGLIMSGIQGPFVTLFGFIDGSEGVFLDPGLIVLGLPIAGVGYKIAKSGFDDLRELAQEQDNNIQKHTQAIEIAQS